MSEIDDRLDRLESQLDRQQRNTLTDRICNLTFTDQNRNTALVFAPASTDVSAEDNSVELPDFLAGYPDNNIGNRSPKGAAATLGWSS